MQWGKHTFLSSTHTHCRHISGFIAHLPKEIPSTRQEQRTPINVTNTTRKHFSIMMDTAESWRSLLGFLFDPISENSRSRKRIRFLFRDKVEALYLKWSTGKRKTNQLRENYLLIFQKTNIGACEINLINIRWGWTTQKSPSSRFKHARPPQIPSLAIISIHIAIINLSVCWCSRVHRIGWKKPQKCHLHTSELPMFVAMHKKWCNSLIP